MVLEWRKSGMKIGHEIGVENGPTTQLQLGRMQNKLQAIVTRNVHVSHRSI